LTPQSTDGADSFQFYCASCHGKTGKGDGPAAAALKVRPPDLTSLARRNGGVFPRDRVLAVVAGTGQPAAAHGSSEMPVWGPIFRWLESADTRARLRLENLVAQLESLQEPSSASGGLGARLFSTHCATCHGRDARGDGPLAGQLRRPPPDLTKYAENNGGVFPSERLLRIVDGRDVRSHGDRDMPVWGDAFRSMPRGLTEDEARARVAAIVSYLRTIQQRAG
jgi:mono/diheme cytochrome c family protein